MIDEKDEKREIGTLSNTGTLLLAHKHIDAGFELEYAVI